MTTHTAITQPAAGATRSTVVICAYTEDRWGDLVAAIDALTDQTRRPDEVLIVIDHNSALLERAEQELTSPVAGPSILIRENTRESGLSGARNTAIALAETELLAFLDDDATPEATWLQHLLAPFDDPNVYVTGGRADARWPDERPGWFPEEFDWVVGSSYRGLPRQTAPVRNVIGCSMAFRAEVFRQVGGFVEGVGRVGTLPRGCEETELCIRLRQRRPEAEVVYVPDSVVRHRVSPNRTKPRYFISRCYHEGVSKAQIGRLVGAADGTSSERSYAMRTLPAGVARGLAQSIRSAEPAGAGRALAIVVGLATTSLGYLRGLVRK